MEKIGIKNRGDLKFGRADNLPLAMYFAKYCLDRKNNARNALDLGCGYGELVGAFNELGIRAYGVDLALGALKAAKQRVGIRKVKKINLVNDKLPFDDNFFDVVTAIEVVEHLEETGNFFSEAYRVLMPGGLFLMTTPNDGSLFDKVFRNFVLDDPTHINKHKEKYWTSEINKFGFRTEELKVIGFFGFPPAEYLRNIFREAGLPVYVNPVFSPLKTLGSTLFFVSRR